jgi:transposase
MDNASYHRSKAVQAALSSFEDRVHMHWLPKYSPFLNMIERFWLHFKQLAVANRLYHTLDDLAQTAHEVMANQNTDEHHNQLRLLDTRELCFHM